MEDRFKVKGDTITYNGVTYKKVETPKEPTLRDRIADVIEGHLDMVEFAENVDSDALAQDQMEHYRIKKVTKGDGTVWYYPQKKVLWFWKDLGLNGCFSTKGWANAIILEDFQKLKKDKIEYLEYDTSQTVPSEPNPPPKVL